MSQNNSNPPSEGFNTQKADTSGSTPNISMGEAKNLHNMPIASSADNVPRDSKDVQNPQRRKRLSFGGGNDGRGAPLFSNLEAAKGRHMQDTYDDMKPADGIIGSAWKNFVRGKSANTPAGVK